MKYYSYISEFWYSLFFPEDDKTIMEFFIFSFTQIFSNYRVDDELYESLCRKLVDGLLPTLNDQKYFAQQLSDLDTNIFHESTLQQSRYLPGVFRNLSDGFYEMLFIIFRFLVVIIFGLSCENIKIRSKNIFLLRTVKWSWEHRGAFQGPP